MATSRIVLALNLYLRVRDAGFDTRCGKNIGLHYVLMNRWKYKTDAILQRRNAGNHNCQNWEITGNRCDVTTAHGQAAER